MMELPTLQLVRTPDVSGEPLRVRAALLRRLIEIVSWPETRLHKNERELVADVLIGLLKAAPVEMRRRCAERLVNVQQTPKMLLRFLARDEIEAAGPLLDQSTAFDDSDLVATVRRTMAPHWVRIANRKKLSETVCDALVETGSLEAIEPLLRNQTARLSSSALDVLVRYSRERPELAPLIAARAELTAALGLMLFWWSDHETRMLLLRRFAGDRTRLIDETSDLFKDAAADAWSDPEVRKVLQFIERRQRNRAAAARSVFGSLEAAIDFAAQRGVDKALAMEIAHLAGIRPATGLRIMNDAGGESLAVLCKACGLKRPAFLALWGAMGRDADPLRSSPLEKALTVYETLAVVKAQTVLRYWNWALTSDPAIAEAVAVDPEFAPARRFSELVGMAR